MKRNYIRDLENDKLLTIVLDKLVYPCIFNNVEVTRYTDREVQNKGIDIVIEPQPCNAEMKVDEKAQIGYINHPLSTFAFEILYGDSYGKIHDGWFIRKDLETTHYFLIYPYARNVVKGKLIKPSQYTRIDLEIVEKKSLKSLLKERYGITEDFLEDEAKLMIEGGVNRVNYEDDIRIVRSPQFKEYPSNLVIPRKILAQTEGFLYNRIEIE